MGSTRVHAHTTTTVIMHDGRCNAMLSYAALKLDNENDKAYAPCFIYCSIKANQLLDYENHRVY